MIFIDLRLIEIVYCASGSASGYIIEKGCLYQVLAATEA
jgi:hypothetical protein